MRRAAVAMLLALPVVAGCHDESGSPGGPRTEPDRYLVDGTIESVAYGRGTPFLVVDWEAVALIGAPERALEPADESWTWVGFGAAYGDGDPSTDVEVVAGVEVVVESTIPGRTDASWPVGRERLAVATFGLSRDQLVTLLPEIVPLGDDVTTIADRIQAADRGTEVIYAGPAVAWDVTVTSGDDDHLAMLSASRDVDRLAATIRWGIVGGTVGGYTMDEGILLHPSTARPTVISLEGTTVAKASSAEWIDQLDALLDDTDVTVWGTEGSVYLSPGAGCDADHGARTSCLDGTAIDGVEVEEAGDGWRLVVSFTDEAAQELAGRDIPFVNIALGPDVILFAPVAADEPVSELTVDAVLTDAEADLFADHLR